MYQWSRNKGYEVSTRGDKRFSAFVARIADGRTIEQHYQCCVKGYEPGGTNWRLGKGKPSLQQRHLDHPDSLYQDYLSLWRQFVGLNPGLFEQLRRLADEHDKTLRDRFATTPINQARALAQLLNESREVKDD
jgi:hypothetical protein